VRIVKALLTVSEAQRLVLERIEPLPLEDVPTADGAGRILGEPARAAVDLPPFPSSAMDGFAVRAADLPGSLPVVASIAAGSPAPRPLNPGEAMAIATGGVVPDGADAVIPIEHVVEDDNTIETAEAVDPGAHVRPRGGDVRAGDVVLEAGTLLAPAAIGALAAAGIPRVRCAGRPRLVVLATGSELARPGEPLRPGQIYDSNGAMLAAAATAVGAHVEVLPTVEDTPEAHRRVLERALVADVVVTTGGVSVGQLDLVRQTEAELGVEEVFWQVAVKPGKPIAFGVRGRTLVFGLPGNPVSSLVGFELFVRPALLALQGARDPMPRFERGMLAASVRRNPVRDEFLRARTRPTGNGTVLEPVSGQESHMIVRAAAADALVFAPRGDGELASGETVDYLKLR
jgi:molybdopterin molybdotransferase